MQHKIIIGTLCTVLLGASTNLLAAGAMAPQQNKPQGDKPLPRAEKPMSKSTPAMSPSTSRKGSEVVGATLRDRGHEEIGEVEDLVVDPTTGRIDFAVISLDKEGVDDRWFAVPFDQLGVPTPMVGEDARDASSKDMASEFTLKCDPAKFETARGFSKDKWPDMNAPAWRMEMDKHFDVQKRGETPVNGDVIVSRQSARLSKLLSEDLYTQTGEKLGEVNEIAVDPHNARIAFMVVSTGGFLGIGDTLHAIPWDAIQAEPSGSSEAKRLQVNVTKERLEKAPEFHKDQWARMSEQAWISDLYKYYGLRAYGSDMKDGANARVPKTTAPVDAKAPKQREKDPR